MAGCKACKKVKSQSTRDALGSASVYNKERPERRMTLEASSG